LELAEERDKKISDLGKRNHLFKGRVAQKLEEEQAYTLPLECWGFGRNHKENFISLVRNWRM